MYQEHECIRELKKFLFEACGDENVKKKLRTLLEKQANEVGLLVSQRFVNCPHQLVPPLYDALFDEVSWATEDEVGCFVLLWIGLPIWLILIYSPFHLTLCNLGIV